MHVTIRKICCINLLENQHCISKSKRKTKITNSKYLVALLNLKCNNYKTKKVCHEKTELSAESLRLQISLLNNDATSDTLLQLCLSKNNLQMKLLVFKNLSHNIGSSIVRKTAYLAFYENQLDREIGEKIIAVLCNNSTLQEFNLSECNNAVLQKVLPQTASIFLRKEFRDVVLASLAAVSNTDLNAANTMRIVKYMNTSSTVFFSNVLQTAVESSLHYASPLPPKRLKNNVSITKNFAKTGNQFYYPDILQVQLLSLNYLHQNKFKQFSFPVPCTSNDTLQNYKRKLLPEEYCLPEYTSENLAVS